MERKTEKLSEARTEWKSQRDEQAPRSIKPGRWAERPAQQRLDPIVQRVLYRWQSRIRIRSNLVKILSSSALHCISIGVGASKYVAIIYRESGIYPAQVTLAQTRLWTAAGSRAQTGTIPSPRTQTETHPPAPTHQTTENGGPRGEMNTTFPARKKKNRIGTGRHRAQRTLER